MICYAQAPAIPRTQTSGASLCVLARGSGDARPRHVRHCKKDVRARMTQHPALAYYGRRLLRRTRLFRRRASHVFRTAARRDIVRAAQARIQGERIYSSTHVGIH